MKKLVIVVIFLFLGFFIFSNSIEKGFVYQKEDLFTKNIPILKIQKLEKCNSEIPIYPPKKENRKTSGFECVLSSFIFFNNPFSKNLESNKERLKKKKI